MTLVEVVVALAIVGFVAAAILPVLTFKPEWDRVELAKDRLYAIDTAIYRFRQVVTANVGRLSHLSTAITTSDSSPCTNYTTQEVNKWPTGTPPNGGPFLKEVLPRDSFALERVGMVQDKTVREPSEISGPGNVHFLSFFITGVHIDDAKEMNDWIDGSADLDPTTSTNLTGKIQWHSAPTAQGFVTVKYRVIITRQIC